MSTAPGVLVVREPDCTCSKELVPPRLKGRPQSLHACGARRPPSWCPDVRLECVYAVALPRPSLPALYSIREHTRQCAVVSEEAVDVEHDVVQDVQAPVGGEHVGEHRSQLLC